MKKSLYGLAALLLAATMVVVTIPSAQAYTWLEETKIVPSEVSDVPVWQQYRLEAGDNTASNRLCREFLNDFRLGHLYSAASCDKQVAIQTGISPATMDRLPIGTVLWGPSPENTRDAILARRVARGASAGDASLVLDEAMLTKMLDMPDRLDSLDEQVEANKTAVAKNATAIDEVQKRLADVEQGLKQQDDKLAKLPEDLTTLATKVEENAKAKGAGIGGWVTLGALLLFAVIVFALIHTWRGKQRTTALEEALFEERDGKREPKFAAAATVTELSQKVEEISNTYASKGDVQSAVMKADEAHAAAAAAKAEATEAKEVATDANGSVTKDDASELIIEPSSKLEANKPGAHRTIKVHNPRTNEAFLVKAESVVHPQKPGEFRWQLDIVRRDSGGGVLVQPIEAENLERTIRNAFRNGRLQKNRVDVPAAA